jgi:hypothetical protein
MIYTTNMCIAKIFIPRDFIYRTYKAPNAVRSFLIYCASTSVLITPYSFTRALYQIPAETSSGKGEKTWREMSITFDGEVFMSYSARIFNMP